MAEPTQQPEGGSSGRTRSEKPAAGAGGGAAGAGGGGPALKRAQKAEAPAVALTAGRCEGRRASQELLSVAGCGWVVVGGGAGAAARQLHGSSSSSASASGGHARGRAMRTALLARQAAHLIGADGRCDGV
jgi:hypothetical protein